MSHGFGNPAVSEADDIDDLKKQQAAAKELIQNLEQRIERLAQNDVSRQSATAQRWFAF
jgi:hypothetical protein